MARPKISAVRDMLNLTATEYECLVYRARAAALRPAHFGRMLCLTKKSYQLRQCKHQQSRAINLPFSRVGSNLNQMMRHLLNTQSRCRALACMGGGQRKAKDSAARHIRTRLQFAAMRLDD